MIQIAPTPSMDTKGSSPASKFSLLWVPIFLYCLHAAASLPPPPPPPSSSLYTRSSFGMRNSYPAIFVFGDSLSDPANRAIASTTSSFKTMQLPYGETFPGWPTGRYSDGRNLVDLLATYMDLPLLSPYLNRSADFRGGVNYAVGGATALNAAFLNSLGIYPATNLSLDVQLAWHIAFKASVDSPSSDGSQEGSPTSAYFSDGLYVIEIGGNDYGDAYIDNYPPSFVNSTLIPLVIQKIHNAVETLLAVGAKNFLFISVTPLGCSPCMLARFDGIKDSNGCLEEYNLASYYHGVHVQEEVAKLRALYPSATFLFMDYYGAYTYVLENKGTFGFADSLDACCGAGAAYPYNYNPYDECNIYSAYLCTDPNVHISWDGIHYTDSFNFQIFNQTFVTGSYLDTLQYTLL